MTHHFLISPEAPDAPTRRRLVEIEGHTIRARIYAPVAGKLNPAAPFREVSNCLIDTGASDVFIDASIAAELNLRERNPRTIKTIRGDAGGVGYGAYLAIPDLHFGENIEVVALRMQGQGRMNYDIVLGRTFLERYRVQYDGPSGTMLFEWGSGIGPSGIEEWDG